MSGLAHLLAFATVFLYCYPIPDLLGSAIGAMIRFIFDSENGDQKTGARICSSIVAKSRSIQKPAVPFAPLHSSPVAGLSVIPISDKYDALGNAVSDLPFDYLTHNSIFDGHRVRLSAVAGRS